jgi:cholesterol oxidase
MTRTNSEALVGAMTTDRRYGAKTDFTKGVAITSSIHPDANTHIEPVRYGKGSNAMGMLSVQQVPPGGPGTRWLRFLAAAAAHPTVFVRSLNKRRWSERTIIGLVMQSLDNSIVVHRKRSGLGKGKLTSRQGHGAPNPTWIPAAQHGARELAAEINGFPGSSVGEILDIPLTAHFIGGCPISETPETGVVDPYQRLHGHPGISVVDGSAISANLGVNPSLTITAQAERAMALWPNAGDPDPRPAQDEPYRRVSPVAPAQPAVPAGAFAAYRVVLPVPEVPKGG